MQVKSLGLAWIVVKDFKKAVQFYTEVVGLKLIAMHEEFPWAELEGYEGGAKLGISGEGDGFKAGDNACVTFTVESIEQAREELLAKGATCVGEIQEVPGHVKLQMVVDPDGNHVQLVEEIS